MVDKNHKGVMVNCKGEKDSSVIHCIISNLRTAAIIKYPICCIHTDDLSYIICC